VPEKSIRIIFLVEDLEAGEKLKTIEYKIHREAAN